MSFLSKLFGSHKKEEFSLEGLNFDNADQTNALDHPQDPLANPQEQDHLLQDPLANSQAQTDIFNPNQDNPNQDRSSLGANQPVFDNQRQYGQEYTKETIPNTQPQENKDLQLIMSKLDLINSRLENISRRLEMIEQKPTPQRRTW